MLIAEASQVVAASAEDVLAFVMDLDRYRQADTKIRRVRWTRSEGDELVAALWTRTRGMVQPVTQRLRLTPGVRIDITNEPNWQDRLVTFRGEFVCEPVEGGVRVTHRYVFDFRGLGKLSERLLGSWLQRDIVQEVLRLRMIVEQSRDSG